MNKIIVNPLWSLVVITNPFKLVSCHLHTYSSRDLCWSNSLMATVMHCKETTPESLSPVCSMNQIIDHPLWTLVVIPKPFNLLLWHLLTYSSRNLCWSSVLMATVLMHHKESTPYSPSPSCLMNQIVDHPLWSLQIIPNPFKLVLCHHVHTRGISINAVHWRPLQCTTRNSLQTPFLLHAQQIRLLTILRGL